MLDKAIQCGYAVLKEARFGLAGAKRTLRKTPPKNKLR